MVAWFAITVNPLPPHLTLTYNQLTGQWWAHKKWLDPVLSDSATLLHCFQKTVASKVAKGSNWKVNCRRSLAAPRGTISIEQADHWLERMGVIVGGNFQNTTE